MARKKKSKQATKECTKEDAGQAGADPKKDETGNVKRKRRKPDATTDDKPPTNENTAKEKKDTTLVKGVKKDDDAKTAANKTTMGAVTAKPGTIVKNVDAKEPDKDKDKDKDKNALVDAKLAELEALMDAEIARALVTYPWYHGLMPRDEISDLLTDDGSYLVRKTDVGGKPRYAVSVMNKGRIRHILLNYKEGKWWLKDLKKNTLSGLIQEHVDTKTPVQNDGTILVKAVPRPEFYILHEHIEIGKKLGGGAFADVHIGKLKLTDKDPTEVAVKKLKGAMTKKQRGEFMREAKLMKNLDHPNIVRMMGVAPQEEPVMIVLELAQGCLKNKLKENPDLAKDKLTEYVVGACRGMCYLANRKIIHRDIAARNCLLNAKDEVKISDFGLSVADKSVLKLDKLKSMPIKWLAPETLRKGEFSTKSDVWSFGVLIYEVFAKGVDPFEKQTNAEAKAKILSKETPLVPPEGTPDLPKAVMLLCFTQDSEARPDFTSVFKLLAPSEIPPPPPINFETYAVPPASSSPAPSSS